jgi:ABC-type Zn2+ transport system substrate-binding protein/surface adhesin
MVGLFALAPALSMALAAPVGAFSRSLVHTHADDEPGHDHHGHHHHHSHQHDHGDHDHGDAGNGGDLGDPGQHRMHVHFDACCPSLVLPAQDATPVQRRPSDRLAILPVEPMQGAPPDDLLRPPIPLSF